MSFTRFEGGPVEERFRDAKVGTSHLLIRDETQAS